MAAFQVYDTHRDAYDRDYVPNVSLPVQSLLNHPPTGPPPTFYANPAPRAYFELPPESQHYPADEQHKTWRPRVDGWRAEDDEPARGAADEDDMGPGHGSIDLRGGSSFHDNLPHPAESYDDRAYYGQRYEQRWTTPLDRDRDRDRPAAEATSSSASPDYPPPEAQGRAPPIAQSSRSVSNSLASSSSTVKERKTRRARRKAHEIPRDASNRRYSCDVCQPTGEKSFARPSALKLHMLTHTKVKDHTCPTCHRAFSISSNLRRHQKLHVAAHGAAN